MNQNVDEHRQEPQPEYLYHYTSIESLAAILSTKTIRLSQLTNVDDLQESKSDDAYNFARFIYVSSWTENDDESIPMWKMYTQMSQGVRIKLEKVPFKEYDIKPEDIPAKQRADSLSSVPFRLILPTKRLFSNEYLFMPYVKEGLLQKVMYTSSDQLLYPKILIEKDGNSTLDIGLLGLYKNTSWQFQGEWRYKVWMAPGSLIEAMAYQKLFPAIVLRRMKDSLLPKLPSSVYLDLDDEAFSRMEICLSPSISDGSRKIVELLKERYNPSVRIVASALAGTIR